jgi:hypothetical protein
LFGAQLGMIKERKRGGEKEGKYNLSYKAIVSTENI